MKSNQRSAQSLTPRELQTLQFIVLGKTDHEIAVLMNVTVHTINAYRKSLLHKMGANNVASLVRIAFEQQLVDTHLQSENLRSVQEKMDE